MSNDNRPETVPFSEAIIEKIAGKKFEWDGVELPKDRRVLLGKCNDGSVRIVVERPTLDGKISQLDFGLTKDAYEALSYLMNK